MAKKTEKKMAKKTEKKKDQLIAEAPAPEGLPAATAADAESIPDPAAAPAEDTPKDILDEIAALDLAAPAEATAPAAKKKATKKAAGALANPDLPPADGELKTAQDIDYAIVIEPGRHYTDYFHAGAKLTDKNLIRELMPKEGQEHVPGCIKLEVHYREVFAR